MNTNKRNVALDYIRILAIFLIVNFHYFSERGVTAPFAVRYANDAWGTLGNSLFFLLSGYLLNRNFTEKVCVKTFYRKRFLAIYPEFYLAFAGAFCLNAFLLKKLFFAGPAYLLIYTLLGIDKYVQWYGISNYALVAEWYSAVIVVMYLLFPLLRFLYRKAKWITTAALAVLYVVWNVCGIYPVNAEISILCNLCVFWTGMLLAQYINVFYKKKTVPIAIGTLAAALLSIKLPINSLYASHILATCLFIFLNWLLRDAKPEIRSSKAVSWFSGLTYSIYLVHHYILLDPLSLRLKLAALNIPEGVWYFAYLSVTVLVAWALHKITKFILKSLSK